MEDSAGFMKTLSIFFFMIAVLILLSAIVLPMIFSSNLINIIHDKTILDIDNVNLWGSFPGKLKSELKHKFIAFNLDKITNSTIEVTLHNQSYSIYENVKYKNFKFSAQNNEVKFRAEKNFIDNNTNDINFSHIDQGMLETISVLSNNSTYNNAFRANKLFIDYVTPDLANSFIKKLFSIDAYNKIMTNKKLVFNTILNGYSEEIKEKLYSHQKGLGNENGFFKWIDMIGDNKKIQSANWIIEEFDISDAVTIIGSNSFLNTYFIFFNNKLSSYFKCNKICGFDLIFRQIYDNSVTEFINIKNMKMLDDKLGLVHPLYRSIEMKTFFEENYYKLENKTYTDYLPSYDIIISIFSKDNNTSLQNLANVIDLLNFNKTQDLYSAYKKFKFISINSIFFITDYIFRYLSDIFLYPIIQDNIRIEPISKTFVSLLNISLTNSYSKLNNLKKITLSKIIFHLFSNDNLCIDIFKTIIKNEEHIKYICSNKELDMKSYKSIKNWIIPYDCINYDCNEEEKSFLKNLAKIDNTQLSYVYTSLFGKYIDSALKIFNENYNNLNSYSDNDIINLQFNSSYITDNLPYFLKMYNSKSIYLWDNYDFNAPVELNYYVNIYSCYDCYNTDFLNLDKINMEKAFSLYINNQTDSNNKIYKSLNITDPIIYFKTLRHFIEGNLFSKINKEYNYNSIIYGSNDETLNILRNGSIFDNFVPNIIKSTGIDFNEINELSMNTGINSDVRIIKKINNFKYYNKLYNNKSVPIYDNIELYEISDGFEYESKNIIYYYDQFTSRNYKFTFYSVRSFNEIECNYYIMSDFNTSIEEKFNKPYSLYTQEYFKNNKNLIINNIDLFKMKENYICVDEFSKYVISSNITLFYSIDTKNYENIIPSIPLNTTIPLFMYTRTYDIETESFKKEFVGIISYPYVSLWVRLIGFLIAAVFLTTSICFYLRFKHTVVNNSNRLYNRHSYSSEL